MAMERRKDYDQMMVIEKPMALEPPSANVGF